MISGMIEARFVKFYTQVGHLMSIVSPEMTNCHLIRGVRVMKPISKFLELIGIGESRQFKLGVLTDTVTASLR